MSLACLNQHAFFSHELGKDMVKYEFPPFSSLRIWENNRLENEKNDQDMKRSWMWMWMWRGVRDLNMRGFPISDERREI